MAPSGSVDGPEVRPADSGASRSCTSLNEPDRVPNGQRKKKKYRFYKRFTYQQLRGWKPILSANEAVMFFSVAGTILLALGIPILVASLNVVEYQIRYDDAGQLAPLSNEDRAQQVTQGDGVTYQLKFTVDKEMKSPIYVGFVLDVFYQNYRRYVRSYDPQQMHDGDIFPGVSACNPFLYEGFDENSSLPESGAILPCGQISHSNFNDSFLIGSVAGDIPIDSSDIAWQSDADNLYGDVDSVNFNIQPQYRGGNTTSAPLNQDQHWMQCVKICRKHCCSVALAVAVLPTFSNNNTDIMNVH
eukprot:jgi/Picsp_1/710/NSC_04199-R1_ala-interacting subunit 3-like